MKSTFGLTNPRRFRLFLASGCLTPNVMQGDLRLTPFPGQQFVDAVDGMVGVAGDDVGEPGCGFDAVEFGGFDQRKHDRGAPTASVGTGEEIILTSEGQRAEGALRGLVAHFQAAVLDVASEQTCSKR